MRKLTKNEKGCWERIKNYRLTTEERMDACMSLLRIILDESNPVRKEKAESLYWNLYRLNTLNYSNNTGENYSFEN